MHANIINVPCSSYLYGFQIRGNKNWEPGRITINLTQQKNLYNVTGAKKNFRCVESVFHWRTHEKSHIGERTFTCNKCDKNVGEQLRPKLKCYASITPEVYMSGGRGAKGGNFVIFREFFYGILIPYIGNFFRTGYIVKVFLLCEIMSETSYMAYFRLCLIFFIFKACFIFEKLAPHPGQIKTPQRFDYFCWSRSWWIFWSIVVMLK